MRKRYHNASNASVHNVRGELGDDRISLLLGEQCRRAEREEKDVRL